MAPSVHVVHAHGAINPKNRSGKRAGGPPPAYSDVRELVKKLRRKMAPAKKKAAARTIVHGPWKVIFSKNKPKVVSAYRSKQDAIDAARRMARARNVRNVIIHGKTGQILQKSQAQSSLNEADLRRAIRKILEER